MRTLAAGLVAVAVALVGTSRRAAAVDLGGGPMIYAPRAALADPTVLVMGPGALAPERLPDIATYVDDVEVQPVVARRRVAGGWAWALTIPARAGTVVVRWRDTRWADTEAARFPIVAQVAAPVVRWAASPERSEAIGDDVVVWWPTCQSPDGRGADEPPTGRWDPCVAPGMTVVRANGEVVRFERPLVVSPLAWSRLARPSPTHAWRWPLVAGVVAVAAVVRARRRRRSIAAI